MNQDEYSLLLSQFKPSEEDKAAARNMGFMRAGLGILAANKPSPYPTNNLSILAQGGMQGLDGYATDLKGRTDERRTASTMALQAAKIKKDMAAQDALKNFYGSPAPSPAQAALTAGAAEGDIGPTQTNLKRLDAFQSNPQAVPTQVPNFGALIAAGVPGETVKAMMEDWKLKNPELKFDGGIPRNPRTGMPISGVPVTPQTNQQGFSTTPRFNHQTGQFEVGVTPGSPDAYRLQQEITESAKASRDPFMGVTDANGRPIPMTREGFAGTYGGVGAPGASAPQGQPSEQMGSTSDIRDFAATHADAFRRVQEASKRGQTATITVDPSRAGGMGPTPAQRESDVTAAQGDAKRVLELEAKIPNMLSVTRRLDRMQGLTADDKTYAAAGAELKNNLGSIAQAFGLNVNKGKTANTEEYLAHIAELLKDRLASKDFGSGSGVSNLDIIAARAPLPELAKTAQGRQQIIQALRADTERNLKDAQAARDYFDENKGLRGFRFPSEHDAERQRRERELPKTPGTAPGALPQGVTVKRIR